jgi:hypothetical protein
MICEPCKGMGNLMMTLRISGREEERKKMAWFICIGCSGRGTTHQQLGIGEIRTRLPKGHPRLKDKELKNMGFVFPM